MKFSRDDKRKLYEAYKVLDNYINNPHVTTFSVFVNGIDIKVKISDYIPLADYFKVESRLKKLLKHLRLK